MPIRHCQKCSLKVLIDDAQASVSPFYCQRCTAALKGDGDVAASAPAPAVARRASSPRLTPVPASTAVAVEPDPTSKPGTVKVFCPYCKASFNGRIPSKPARGSCPLCQKDLILLPTGDIRPAADFDLGAWQSEQGAPAANKSKESGTVALVKKFAAEPPKRKPEPPPPPPPPAEETQTSEDGVELPSWLDDESKRVAQNPSAPVVAAAETDVADAVRIEDLDPLPPPPPSPKRSPPPVPAKAPASEELLPEPEEKPAVSIRKGTARREKTDRRAAAPMPVGAATGTGKFLLALLLTFLPVGACPVLLTSKEKLEEKFLKPMGARFTRGFRALDAKLFPVEAAPAPAPKAAPKAEPEPEAPAKPTAEDQRQMEEEINKHWMEYKREERTFRQKSVGATPAEKAEFQKVETDLKEKLARIDQLKANYRKLFGKDYDPTKQ